MPPVGLEPFWTGTSGCRASGHQRKRVTDVTLVICNCTQSVCTWCACAVRVAGHRYVRPMTSTQTAAARTVDLHASVDAVKAAVAALAEAAIQHGIGRPAGARLLRLADDLIAVEHALDDLAPVVGRTDDRHDAGHGAPTAVTGL